MAPGFLCTPNGSSFRAKHRDSLAKHRNRQPKHYFRLVQSAFAFMRTHLLPAPEQATALAETNRRPLVRAEVIAKHFDVHPRTVLLWAESKTIPCTRIGGAVRFDLEAVLGATR